MRIASLLSLRVLPAGLLLAFFCVACTANGSLNGDDPPASLFNLSHLDHLGERIEHAGAAFRIIHIYAEAPDYQWVPDPVEGAACVDDAARAAVVYLRHFQTTGTTASREKAEELIRFIMYMQREDGLFYNFVYSNRLDVNTDHANSRAEPFSWWAARGVWALGTCAEVLATANPAFADACQRRAERTYAHLDGLLERYPSESSRAGRRLPNWLIYESASDATSELLLGLNALERGGGDAGLRMRIARFAEGLEMMRYGTMTSFPYGAHASWVDVWHAYGNSQTQALSEAGRVESAVHEAEHFYPRLLVEGWLHSFSLDHPNQQREFEQIAYGVRAMSVGLIRLFEATGDVRYAQMAGLAASWLTGNNVANTVMYDRSTGRGYDGINSATTYNRNSGAESTIEALYTILETERHPEAHRWLNARGDPPLSLERGGKTYRYRVFRIGQGTVTERLALVMNLTDEALLVLEGEALEEFLK
jgi:hypothetical protein